jgi:hypothetical protein
VVVTQQSTERAGFANLAIPASDFLAWIDEDVANALVVPPSMIVVGIGQDGGTQGAVAEEDDVVGAFPLNGLDHALGEGIAVWCSRWDADAGDAAIREDADEAGLGERAIAESMARRPYHHCRRRGSFFQ